MWWVKKLLGSGNNTYIDDLSEDSSNESDFDYYLEVDKKSQVNSNTALNSSRKVTLNHEPDIAGSVRSLDLSSITEMNTTDAAVKTSPNPREVLQLEAVLEIEKNLDKNEMVSVIYLLHEKEDPKFTLQELMLYLDGARKTLLYNWANSEERSGHPWQQKLIEALSIIKNYQILRTLGYDKIDIKAQYLPHLPNSITNLNKTRKVIYLICEKLGQEKTDLFLGTVKSHMGNEKDTVGTYPYDCDYLELFFLNLEANHYISLNDVSKIKTVLKIMGEDAVCDMLESVMATPESRVEEKRLQALIEKKPSTSTDTHQNTTIAREYSMDFQSSSSNINPVNNIVSELSNVDNYRYYINTNNPGLLLIINQEDFYTEIDKKLSHLMPKDISRNKLESRKGTEKDKTDLTNVFERFGFRVKVENNLTHEELLSAIRKTVKEITTESSLFICILSHGDKGVVYGVNSCKVEVNQIKDIMSRINKENLEGKPKILLLQSCQGQQCQKLNEFSDDEELAENQSNTTDGPSSSKISVSRRADMLTFWATVPGYAAIRNKNTGSWFIQALCKKMAQIGNEHHFLDICTRIVNDVSEAKWVVKNEENVMTPMIEHTLRKDFFLPPMKEQKI